MTGVNFKFHMNPQETLLRDYLKIFLTNNKYENSENIFIDILDPDIKFKILRNWMRFYIHIQSVYKKLDTLQSSDQNLLNNLMIQLYRLKAYLNGDKNIFENDDEVLKFIESIANATLVYLFSMKARLPGN